MGDDNNDGTKCSFTEQLIMTVHMQICTMYVYYRTAYCSACTVKVYGLLCKLFLNSSEIAVFTTTTPIFFQMGPFIIQNSRF